MPGFRSWSTNVFSHIKALLCTVLDHDFLRYPLIPKTLMLSEIFPLLRNKVLVGHDGLDCGNFFTSDAFVRPHCGVESGDMDSVQVWPPVYKSTQLISLQLETLIPPSCRMQIIIIV